MAIRILEEGLVNKIAAGEVVERPASVVKELVENALDAGAAELRVHLRAGGRNLVRVVDDGSGMDRTDALMCLERHATSKIRTDDDLFRVATLGFRGEAVPSIASVCKFELLTRTRDSDSGTRVTVDGGKLMGVDPAGCAPGTDISVASLFYNVPARRKFLRTVDTELAHCVEAITRELLIRPHVDLEVTHDDRLLLRCARTDSHRQRAAELLGPHGEALVPISFTRGELRVEGLVSPIGVHRQSATGSSYLYVNGRFVRDMVVRKAVSQAYAGLVPKERYPVVVLRVEVPPEEVDVNVHPAKTEVRFVRAYELQNAIAEGLRNALTEHGIQRPVQTESRYRAPGEPPKQQLPLVPPTLQWGPRAAEPLASAPRERAEPPPSIPPSFQAVLSPSAPAPVAEPSPPERVERAPAANVPPPGVPAAFQGSVPDSVVGFVAERTGREPAVSAPRTVSPTPVAPTPSAPPAETPPAAPMSGPPAPEPQRKPMLTPGGRPLLPVARFRDLRIIGQLARTYILCEGGGELVLVDQHAAAERITLTHLEKDPKLALGGSQRLLTPLLVELGPARARVLAAHADRLAQPGLDVSHLGGGTIAVQGVPAPLAGRDLPALLADIADDLSEGGPGTQAQGVLDLVLATLACHTSVRANQALDEKEMRRILEQLDEVDHAVCAHGRPVAIRLEVGEIERRFHRA